MTGDVQLGEPAAELLSVARRVVPEWLRRVALHAAARSTTPTAEDVAAIERMATATAPLLIDRLDHLLRLDVDEQTTNPLSLFRDAVAAPTDLLRTLGVPEPPVDSFARQRFPDDAYGLGPATWSDIDPSLHDAGIAWGAWKAMTVLRRRRDEGLR